MAIYLGTWQDDAGNAFDPASFSLQETGSDPLATLVVYGLMDPDCTGDYHHAGTHDGLAYYERTDHAFVIWWDSALESWTIAEEIEPDPDDYWRASAAIENVYSAYGDNEGSPHVAASVPKELNITGTPSPLCTGPYAFAGLWNDVPFWQSIPPAFFIYWSATWGYWMISAALDDTPTDYWYAPYPFPILFMPDGACTGYPLLDHDPMPDISLALSPSPDATGAYHHAGLHDGFPHWLRTDRSFAIWYDSDTDHWFITTTPGETDPGSWENPSGLRGLYNRNAPYTGRIASATFVAPPTQHWGICRTRVHGRRFGSGGRPGHYEATPVTPAGWYPFPPLQFWARLTFKEAIQAYLDLPPFAPAYVTGVLDPDVIGSYGGMGLHNSKAHWFRAQTTYHIYWDTAPPCWIIGQTFPDVPPPDEPHWYRAHASPYGQYDPYGGATGHPVIFAPEGP